MKRFIIITGILATLLLACISCEEEMELSRPGILFELYDGSSLVDGTIAMRENETKTFAIKRRYVSYVEPVVSDGWTVTVDMPSNTLSVSSPSDGDKYATGTVTLGLKSRKGLTGSYAATLKIVRPPVMSMDPDHVIPGWGATRDIAFTSRYVTALAVKAAPAGWIVEPDLANSVIRVTTPSDGAAPEVYGDGRIELEAENEMGETLDVVTFVHMQADQGIANRLDFMAFADAVAAGQPVDSRLLVGGNPTLAMNVDLTGLENLTFVGSSASPFAGTFDGNGHTVRIGISLQKTDVAGGLFHTLAAGAEVKNLTVAGSILSASTVTGPKSTDQNVTIGAIAAYNQGAGITDCVSSVAFTFRPEGWASLRNNTWACYGSMSGLVTGAAQFRNCISRGKVWMDLGGMRSVGGQVGIVNAPGVVLEDCVNEGELYLDFGDDETYATDNTMYGGLVANSENFETTYTRCINRGDITIDSHNSESGQAVRQIHAVGGIAGASYGTFTGCENYGTIYGKEASAQPERAYGGILGRAWPTKLAAASKPAGVAANSMVLDMTDCINHGEVRHTSNYVGGIAGAVVNAKSSVIKGCINKGAIVNPTVVVTGGNKARQPSALGGLFGEYRGDLVEDCVNEGPISGQCLVQAAGIVGRGRLHWKGAATQNTIRNCVNRGAIDVSTMKGSETAGSSAYLVVGGVLVTQDGTWRLEGCSNTAAIRAAVEGADRTKNIYFVRTGTGTGGKVTADDSTETEQAKTDLITETIIK